MKTTLPTASNYHLASVFNYGFAASGDSFTDTYSLNIAERRSLLPNVPMEAKRTRLAELLRTGRHVTNGEKLKPAVEKPRAGAARLAKSKKVGQLLGVEIEYYPTRGSSIDENGLTDVTSDGSLNSGGQEIRRLTWASKNGRLEGLLAMKINGRVDTACGLHVHVDARHLGKNGLLGPIETYERVIKFYPFLKLLVPQSRRSNRYCKFKNNCAGSAGCNYYERYAAVNFLSYAEHGTFEFRCQGGSTNVVKIETWALLCQWIVNYCANASHALPRNWEKFLELLPTTLRSWCVIRDAKLNYGEEFNERTLSAIAD
jgi:hypothetical protein